MDDLARLWTLAYLDGLARQPAVRPLGGVVTRQGVGRYHRKLLAQVLATKGTICHLCRGEGADTIDHLRPHAKGGLYELANLMPAHKLCNSMRADLDLAEWFAAHPIPHHPILPPSREW